MSVNGFDENKTPRPLIRKLFLGIAAAMLTIPLAVAGCGAQAVSADSSSSSSSETNTGSITNKDKGPITKEAIEKIVSRKLGDQGAGGAPLIRQINLTPGADGVDVILDLNRTEACHAGALVGTATSMAKEVMSALFRYQNVGQVQLALYGTTAQSEDKDKLAVRIGVTKEKAATLDWFRFTDKNVEQLASEFWTEPLVYANWKVYGAQAITDEALKAQANSGVGATP